jgi:hypothetical protein
MPPQKTKRWWWTAVVVPLFGTGGLVTLITVLLNQKKPEPPQTPTPSYSADHQSSVIVGSTVTINPLSGAAPTSTPKPDYTISVLGVTTDASEIPRTEWGIYFHNAAATGNVHTLQVFLQLGINVDTIEGESNGQTALHTAAGSNQISAAHFLLDHGANPNAKSNRGFTPLDIADARQDSNMVALLKDRGAKHRDTPLPPP